MRRRILVLDDDKSLRHLYRTLLEGAGYEITDTADGDSAIAATQKEQFDLLLTDSVHPGPGLATVVAAVRATGPVPVLVVSGQVGPARRSDGVDDGAWLPKPVSNDQLLAAVGKLIGEA